MTDRALPPAAREASYWHLNVMTAVVVILVHAVITTRLDEDVRTFTRLLLFAAIALAPVWPRSWTLWGALTAILMLEMARTPLGLPNHHYALMYVSLALALSLSARPKDREIHLRTSARWILVGIMGLATLQKAMSPEFMNGAYIGYALATGGFAQPLVAFCESCLEVIDANVASVQEFRSLPPDSRATIALASPFPHLLSMTQGFVISILAFEAWLAIAFAAIPERRLVHWSLLAFVGTLGVLRQEFLFISVVSLLGLLSCGRDHVWERRSYALAAIVFAAGAIS